MTTGPGGAVLRRASISWTVGVSLGMAFLDLRWDFLQDPEPLLAVADNAQHVRRHEMRRGQPQLPVGAFGQEVAPSPASLFRQCAAAGIPVWMIDLHRMMQSVAGEQGAISL